MTFSVEFDTICANAAKEGREHIERYYRATGNFGNWLVVLYSYKVLRIVAEYEWAMQATRQALMRDGWIDSEIRLSSATPYANYHAQLRNLCTRVPLYDSNLVGYRVLPLYGGREGVAAFRYMKLDEVLALSYDDTIWVRGNLGDARRVKVNGKVKRWVRTPDRFEVPVKYGMYEYGRFINADLSEGNMLTIVKRLRPEDGSDYFGGNRA